MSCYFSSRFLLHEHARGSAHGQVEVGGVRGKGRRPGGRGRGSRATSARVDSVAERSPPLPGLMLPGCETTN